MLHVYITIDTEYSPAYFKPRARHDYGLNYNRSVAGIAVDGEVGIHYQMDVLEEYGLTGVFFVDPMPGLIWGIKAIADIVEPIIARGHDVQLHPHTEWLDYVEDSPVDGKTGRNMADFTLDEQVVLIDVARDLLIDAGAPAPVAFRAGNYGANDDTLRALAKLGIAYDSSFCPGIEDSACDIRLTADYTKPLHYCGVTEVPIGSIMTRGKGQRHAQLVSLSAQEMIAAIRHAAHQGDEQFTLVSHSFELLSRNRHRVNKLVKRRFEKLCATIAIMRGVTTGTYRDNPPTVPDQEETTLLPHNPVRAVVRIGEQMLVNALYGRA